MDVQVESHDGMYIGSCVITSVENGIITVPKDNLMSLKTSTDIVVSTAQY